MAEQKGIYKVQVAQRNAFWSYECITPTSVKFTWGRIGTADQSTVKEFQNSYKRDQEIDKKIAEKVRKGYKAETEEGIKKEAEVASAIGFQSKIQRVIYLAEPISQNMGGEGREVKTSKTYDAAAGLVVEIFQSWTKETSYIYLTKTITATLTSVKLIGDNLRYNRRYVGNVPSTMANGLRKFLIDTSRAVQKIIQSITVGFNERKLFLNDFDEQNESQVEIVNKIKSRNIGGSSIGEQALFSFAGLGDRLLEL